MKTIQGMVSEEEAGQALKQEQVLFDFVENFAEEGWSYVETIVDVMREPILILDKDLHIMLANDSFYRTFQTEKKETEKKLVYDLGNGQWNIPDLKRLLEDILPKNTFFRGFEVMHDFPAIGKKVMILNARQIHFKEASVSKLFSSIILLAMEDMSEMMAIAETLAGHANHLEARFSERTQKLGVHIRKLERELHELKKKTL